MNTKRPTGIENAEDRMPEQKLYNYRQIHAGCEEKDIFECFWSLETAEGIQLPEERIIPDTCAELIFNFNKPFIRKDKSGKELESYFISLIGQRTEFILVKQFSPVELFSARFSPAALYHLTEINQSNFTHRLTNAVDVFGKEIEVLARRIETAKDFEAKVSICKKFFMAKVSPKRKNDCREIIRAIQIIKASNGNTSLEEIACGINCHWKKVERSFKEKIGLNPKSFSKLVRLIALVNELQKQQKSLTNIGYEFGFADQSHLNKTIFEFTGTSPRKFLKEKNNHIIKMLVSNERMSNFYNS